MEGEGEGCSGRSRRERSGLIAGSSGSAAPCRGFPCERERERERESETGERERGVRGKERAESGSGEGGKKERTSDGEIEAKERERDGARERKAKRERDFTYLHPRSLRGLSLLVDETKRCEARCGGKGTRELGISRSARAKGTVTIFCSFEGI